jgi:Mrp family chromosome partitioning ATPase
LIQEIFFPRPASPRQANESAHGAKTVSNPLNYQKLKPLVKHRIPMEYNIGGGWDPYHSNLIPSLFRFSIIQGFQFIVSMCNPSARIWNALFSLSANGPMISYLIKAVEEFGRAKIPADPADPVAPPARVSELVQLFHAISALNTHSQAYVLQFIGSVPGEGVSMIASSFIEIASQRGKPVLLVDCHSREGDATSPSLIDALHETGGIDSAIEAAPGHPGISVARLSSAEHARLDIDPADLRQLFELAKKSFPVVVLDCPPASQTPESLALARFCDGTVLVVEAEATSRQTIAETKQALERFDGQIIGVVFNRYKTYIPRWLERWI